MARDERGVHVVLLWVLGIARLGLEHARPMVTVFSPNLMVGARFS